MEHEKEQTLFAWRGETAFGITTAIMTRLTEQVGNRVKTKMPRYRVRCRRYSIPCKAVTIVSYRPDTSVTNTKLALTKLHSNNR